VTETVIWTWRGEEVLQKATIAASGGLAEFGLEAEKAAKQELYPGHGYLTGTLQRSTHVATPGYSWLSDNVEPSESSPERGGQLAVPGRVGNKLALELGSGMRYAVPVHQGHHGREGYHWLVIGVQKTVSKIAAILEKRKL